MHPALSVIFFTTLSGAGYGLLFWGAFAALLRNASPGALALCLLPGLVLATVGLLSSLAHLGKPSRAWRAFSQWRTSWLSREGVMAMLTYVPAGLLLASMAKQWAMPEPDGFLQGAATLPLLCVATMACALATVVCTAMIYASLRPIPAWRHAAVVPVYLLFALLSGGLLVAALLATGGGAVSNRVAVAGIVAAIAVALVKRSYWRDIDRTPLPATRGDAIGLPARQVGVFERPHTESNYLTREMGFVVARKHARTLRAIALLLVTVVPVLALLPVCLFVHVDAAPWLAIAAASVLAGAFVERWLFFAEARHLVTLYY